MREPPEAMTVGALAKRAGVNVETIRFYQRRGLMPTPARPYGGIRRYGAADVARLHFIKAAQRLGFTLDDVGELLGLEDARHCDEARRIAEQKLHVVRARLVDLRRIEAVLAELVGKCHATREAVACPLIAALEAEE